MYSCSTSFRDIKNSIRNGKVLERVNYKTSFPPSSISKVLRADISLMWQRKDNDISNEENDKKM